jgi:hypothetical protein
VRKVALSRPLVRPKVALDQARVRVPKQARGKGRSDAREEASGPKPRERPFACETTPCIILVNKYSFALSLS